MSQEITSHDLLSEDIFETLWDNKALDKSRISRISEISFFLGTKVLIWLKITQTIALEIFTNILV